MLLLGHIYSLKAEGLSNGSLVLVYVQYGDVCHIILARQ